MSAKLAVLVGVLVFVALWWAVFRDMRTEWRNDQRLTRSGVQLVGTITAKEPMNHQSVRYDYIVGSTRYTGGPCAIRVDSEFDRIHTGNPIRVTYLPDQPAISVCGDAKAAYSNISGQLFVIVPFWALLGAAAIAFSLHRWFRRRAMTTI